jgi:putative transposase
MATKYRRGVLNDGVLAYLKMKVKEVEEHYPQICVQAFNHDKDHVHLMVEIPPTMSVGSVVRILKANMSTGIKEKFGYLRKTYWGSDGIWSPGYFVSTVGIDEEVIRRYITFQGKQDSGQAQLDLS